LGAITAPCLQAQDSPYKIDFKTRVGLYTGDMRTTHYDNKIIGFGVQFRRELFGPGRAVSAEVTWEHIPGRHNDITDYANNQGPNDFSKGVLNLSPEASWDDRKEAGRGFSLLVGYHSKMPTGFGSELLNQVMGNLEWFAGLRFDRYKVYSEYKFNLYDETIRPAGSFAPQYLYGGGTGGNGVGSGHYEESALSPGAFAGLKYTLDDTISFELATRYFGMKHWDITSGAYYNETAPRIKAGTTSGLSIEFAIVCKLQ
jgi:hypothetical protein